VLLVLLKVPMSCVLCVLAATVAFLGKIIKSSVFFERGENFYKIVY